jgi:UDP-N-acetyl-D-mannosaminuronic acid transferase (WecB/TagA/CpsF family)
MNTTEIKTSSKKYALHSSLTNDEKRRILKRANAIMLDGYPIEKAQRRVGYNIEDMRKWAFDLNYPLVVTKKSKYKAA